MRITYSECEFVALVTQHAMRMRRILSLACPALQCFPHTDQLSDFRKEVIDHKMCFDFLFKFRLKYFLFNEGFSDV
jgi:hypothetical protein